MSYKAFGTNLRRWRELQGMTQDKLSEVLSVERVTVTRWENSQTFPPPKTMQRIAEVTGKPLTWFFEDQPSEEPGAPATSPPPHQSPPLPAPGVEDRLARMERILGALVEQQAQAAPEDRIAQAVAQAVAQSQAQVADAVSRVAQAQAQLADALARQAEESARRFDQITKNCDEVKKGLVEVRDDVHEIAESMDDLAEHERGRLKQRLDLFEANVGRRPGRVEDDVQEVKTDLYEAGAEEGDTARGVA